MMLSQADELTMEGQFDAALIHYEKALDQSPKLTLMQQRARKVQIALHDHFMRKQEHALQIHHWQYACTITQKLTQIDGSGTAEQNYLEALRIQFEDLKTPRPQWELLKSFLYSFKECSIKSVQESRYGMIAQMRLIANIQLQNLIQTQKLKAARLFYQRIQKSQLPLGMIDVWDQQLTKLYLNHLLLLAQVAKKDHLWGEFWIYHSLYQNYLEQSAHKTKNTKHQKQIHELSDIFNQNISLSRQKAANDPFSIFDIYLPSKVAKKKKRRKKRSYKKHEAILTANAFTSTLSALSEVPAMKINMHTFSKNKHSSSSKHKPHNTLKSSHYDIHPVSSIYKSHSNSSKSTIKQSQSHLISASQSMTSSTLASHQFIKAIPQNLSTLSLYPHSHISVYFTNQSSHCKQNKEEKSAEVRSVSAMKTTINPSWSAAIKRVEKQQSEYEARLLKIEELNQAYQTSLKSLQKLQEKTLNPLENKLSQLLKTAKDHEKKREFYQQKINRLRKLQFQQTVQKKERKYLVHRQTDLSKTKKLWQNNTSPPSSQNNVLKRIYHQLNQVGIYFFVDLLLSPNIYIGSNAQKESRELRNQLSKNSITVTIISLWGDIQFYLIDQELQIIKLKLGQVELTHRPQSVVSNETLTQAFNQLSLLKKSSFTYTKELNQLQTQVTEYRSKKTLQKNEIQRVKSYIIEGTKKLIREKSELEKLENLALKVKKDHKQEHYMVFRYPLFEHSLRCQVNWTLQIKRQEDQWEHTFQWSSEAETQDQSHAAYSKYHIPKDGLDFPFNSFDLLAQAQQNLVQRLSHWIQERHFIQLKEAYQYSQHPIVSRYVVSSSDILARLSLINPYKYAKVLSEHLQKKQRYVLDNFPQSLDRQLDVLQTDYSKKIQWYRKAQALEHNY
jgi:hypothetical protein